jgi:hypothetical protein
MFFGAGFREKVSFFGAFYAARDYVAWSLLDCSLLGGGGGRRRSLSEAKRVRGMLESKIVKYDFPKNRFIGRAV